MVSHYLLTPWCRVLLEKLTGLQLVKKFPVFHGTRRFITALTSVHHLSLSWACPIQSIYPHPTSWRSIIILSTHLRLGLPSGKIRPVSPPRPYTPPLLTHTCYMPIPSHSCRFYHPHNIEWCSIPFFFKIVPFWDNVENIVVWAVHRWQYGTCALHAG